MKTPTLFWWCWGWAQQTWLELTASSYGITLPASKAPTNTWQNAQLRQSISCWARALESSGVIWSPRGTASSGSSKPQTHLLWVCEPHTVPVPNSIQQGWRAKGPLAQSSWCWAPREHTWPCWGSGGSWGLGTICCFTPDRGQGVSAQCCPPGDWWQRLW